MGSLIISNTQSDISDVFCFHRFCHPTSNIFHIPRVDTQSITSRPRAKHWRYNDNKCSPSLAGGLAYRGLEAKNLLHDISDVVEYKHLLLVSVLSIFKSSKLGVNNILKP